MKKSFWERHGSQAASKWLKMTGEQMRITANKFHAISSRLARFVANLVQKWPSSAWFQDDRPPVYGLCMTSADPIPLYFVIAALHIIPLPALLLFYMAGR